MNSLGRPGSLKKIKVVKLEAGICRTRGNIQHSGQDVASVFIQMFTAMQFFYLFIIFFNYAFFYGGTRFNLSSPQTLTPGINMRLQSTLRSHSSAVYRSSVSPGPSDFLAWLFTLLLKCNRHQTLV